MKTSRRNISLFSIGVLLMVARPLQSAPQAGAALRIEITPEAYLETTPPQAWSGENAFRTLLIPIKVMLRLDRGTYGVLTVSQPTIGGVSQNSLEVETDPGQMPVTESPVIIRRYSRSGVFPESVIIRRSAAASDDSPAASLIFSLSSSDGVAEWSQSIAIPPAAEMPVPSSH